MATRYVSKSGNDANAGTDPNLPKKTIQSAVTASGNNDTVVVKAGTYQETVAHNGVSTLNFVADGRVIWDGGNTLANLYTTGLAATINFTGFEFARTTQAFFGGSSTWTVTAANCLFHDSPLVCALTTSIFSSLKNCWAYNLTHTTQQMFVFGASNVAVITDNTFDNIPTTGGVIGNVSGTGWMGTVQRNVWSRCAVMIFTANAASTPAAQVCNFNSYNFAFPGTNKFGATVVSSLASWRTQGGTPDLQGQDVDPQFTDRANGMLSPLPGGNIDNEGIGGSAFGAVRVAYGVSNNRNSAQWTTPSASSNAQLVSGLWQQTSAGTPAVITFPTIDLGASLRFRAFRAFLTGEVYPTDVLDSAINDTNPNYHTAEFRFSSVSQADCEAQAFSTVKLDYLGNINFATLITARWVQFRITLRDNGVAA